MKLAVETKKSVSNALCGRGDLDGLRRRRMGERWPVTSARRTSLDRASSRAMFQPIGMPIAPWSCGKQRKDGVEMVLTDAP
jgi:hypothetical protein